MPTIKDVARKAGMSVGTVSRYLNGAALKLESRQRVEDAISALGYRRNALARSMKTGRSMLVGVIVPGLANMFSMRVIEGLERALEEHGFSVLISDCGSDPDKELSKIALLRERRADGLILMPSGQDAQAVLRRAGPMPVVLIDRTMDEDLFDSVLVENEAGACRIVRDAIAHGARRPGMIAGPESVQTARERAAGFRRALAEAGLACAGVAQGDYTVESGRACMEELLEMGVDAVFAANHELTVGALSVARGRDVRVIGFDGMELQALCGERLLSLSQPMEAIGRTAAELLMVRIQAPGALVRCVRLPL